MRDNIFLVIDNAENAFEYFTLMIYDSILEGEVC